MSTESASDQDFFARIEADLDALDDADTPVEGTCNTCGKPYNLHTYETRRRKQVMVCPPYDVTGRTSGTELRAILPFDKREQIPKGAQYDFTVHVRTVAT